MTLSQQRRKNARIELTLDIIKDLSTVIIFVTASAGIIALYTLASVALTALVTVIQ